MIVTVHVRPSARANTIEWLDDTTAKASVTAAPEKGLANKAVIDLLAKDLGVAKSSVSLIRGATARLKQFAIVR